MNVRLVFLLVALAAAAALGGFLVGRHAPAADSHDHGAAPAATYQCPMHPWIKADRPDAKCTICGMALVAASGATGASDAPLDPNLVTLTSAQAAVTGVQTSPVRRGALARTVRVSGIIDDDDTRHRILAARVPGRIEKLHVNFVGADVEAGAPLVTIFSPEMLTAQREFVERIKAGTAVFTLAERSAARERLLELGLTDEEIDILENTLKPTAMVTVRAPMSGTVVSRAVYEGNYVAANDELFQIGDFSRMWFVFDAYEPDLAWLRTGQPVEVHVPSLPGKVLTAPIAFIDPNLNEATRTARVRVVLDNPDRILRHRQTAQAVVVAEAPETLLIPRSAVLQHGGKPVVFVDRGQHAYAAREIQLGRFGDRDAEVLSGLREGDAVVTQGALLLDGQAQLAHAAVGASAHDHGAAPAEKISAEAPKHDAAAAALLRTLAFAAADSATALAADDLPAYRQGFPALRAALDAYVAGFAPAAKFPLTTTGAKLVDSDDIEAVRRAFEPFSTDLADLVRAEHLHHREQLWIYQCPMTPVLGTGRWLSRSHELRNPFFGSAMLECGEEVH
ncbi:MAG: efflux RND transporter periplasmic adaptor subunit [Candidatus Didemnitutus sp.]|nr:efflux RND transporter periplasmic adaptor subunit [Candidatus Didemnitutus sp.]